VCVCVCGTSGWASAGGQESTGAGEGANYKHVDYNLRHVDWSLI